MLVGCQAVIACLQGGASVNRLLYAAHASANGGTPLLLHKVVITLLGHVAKRTRHRRLDVGAIRPQFGPSRL